MLTLMSVTSVTFQVIGCFGHSKDTMTQLSTLAIALFQDHDDNDNNGSRTENVVFILFIFKLVSFGCFV